MSIVHDTATETSTVNLNLHTPEEGGQPSKHPSFSGDCVVDGTSDSIRHSGTVSALYVYPADPPGADYEFSFDLICKTRISGDNPVFYTRLSDTVHTGLRFAWNATGNQISLARIVTGTVTSIGTFNLTPVAGTTYLVQGKIEGTTVSVWIGALDPDSDTPSITGSTGAVTAAGNVGVGNTGSVTNTATTGLHIKNILVDEIPIPDPTPPENTSLPVITGTPEPGQVLSCSTGAWDNTPTDFAYQYTRDTVDIVGATGDTYHVVSGDVNTDIACKVTASNGDGSATATSEAVTIVPPAVPEGWKTGTLYRFSS